MLRRFRCDSGRGSGQRWHPSRGPDVQIPVAELSGGESRNGAMHHDPASRYLQRQTGGGSNVRSRRSRLALGLAVCISPPCFSGKRSLSVGLCRDPAALGASVSDRAGQRDSEGSGERASGTGGVGYRCNADLDRGDAVAPSGAVGRVPGGRQVDGLGLDHTCQSPHSAPVRSPSIVTVFPGRAS